MDFALRCAFAHGTGALRTHIDSYPKQTPDLVAAVRRDARGMERPHRVAGGRALSDRPRAERRGGIPRTVETVAKHGGVLGGLTFLGEAPDAKTDAMLDKVFEAAIANGLDLDFHVDESDSPDARSLGADRRGRAAPQIQGPDRRRALLLARACRRQRARHHHREGRRSAASRSCRCRCATCICRTAQSGRTPRWRGVAPLARARRRRRHRDGRERQHARSVLRLWRSRHAGGVSRGDAHPAFRSFGPAVAQDRRGDAGRGDAACRTAAWRSARRPDWCSRARAR